MREGPELSDSTAQPEFGTPGPSSSATLLQVASAPNNLAFWVPALHAHRSPISSGARSICLPFCLATINDL
jgi:hypothetical protein